MSPEWIAAIVISLGTALINKLWNKSSDDTKSKITAALDEARSIISQCVMTARPGMTADDLIVQLKGVVAIALGRIGIKSDDPTVAALVAALVAAGVQEFVALHPNKTSLVLPIHAKLAPAPKLVA